MIFSRLLCILLTFFIYSNAYGFTIEFQKKGTAAQSFITLGDIARFSEDSELVRTLKQQTVAQAPAAGHSIQLNSRSIIQHFRANLNLTTPITWTGSEVVTVSRDGILISSNTILNTINQFITKNRHNLPAGDIRFIPTSPPLPFMIPKGNLTWEVIPSKPSLVGSKRFSIIYKVDGRVRKNMSVPGKLEILAKAAVLTTALRKGEIIRPEHLTMTTLDIGQLRSPCTNLRKVLGKRLTRSVKEGRPLLLSQVEFPPLIRKGELVKILVRRGNLQLTASGVARADGKPNETIRVKNTSSNKIVYARVAGPGIVEVTL